MYLVTLSIATFKWLIDFQNRLNKITTVGPAL